MNFFAVHEYDWLILVGCAIFPRITMLCLGGEIGAILTTWLHWLGWTIAPHLAVAILATATYWETNPALCIISWMCAFAGSKEEASFSYHLQRRRS